MRGLLASLGINQHALRWMFGSAEASSSFQLKTSFAVRTFQDSRMIYKSFIAKSSLHCLHKRACAGVCAFVVVDVACTKQVSWAPVHVQHVCMLSKYVCYTGVFNTSVHICEQVSSTPVYEFTNTLSAGCAHALVYAQFFFIVVGK